MDPHTVIRIGGVYFDFGVQKTPLYRAYGFRRWNRYRMFGLNDPRETRETAIFYEVRVMVILTGVFFCLFRVRFSLRFRRTTAHWTEFYDCRATVRRPDGSYVAPRPNRQRFTRRRRLSESVRFYSIKREVGISTRPCRRVYIVRPTTLCLTDGERKKKKTYPR